MIKNIIWDFDGVIVDSMPIRDYGFRKILEGYDSSLVNKLIEYHNQNGGLSRYVKIKYFFENILNKNISKEEIDILANDFSIIMKKELVKKNYLIQDSIKFIEKYHNSCNFHIASGSDEKELNYLCQELGIDKYFISIYGSPRDKNCLVKTILEKYNYNEDETILIGDSYNDYEAAKLNNIVFYGFNNYQLEIISTFYVHSFREFTW